MTIRTRCARPSASKIKEIALLHNEVAGCAGCLSSRAKGLSSYMYATPVLSPTRRLTSDPVSALFRTPYRLNRYSLTIPAAAFDLSSLCWGSSTHFNTRAHISPSLRRHTSFQKIPEIPQAK